jgi:hypothetical protein
MQYHLKPILLRNVRTLHCRHKTSLAGIEGAKCLIGGLSRFSSREDLKLSLGNLQPLYVDPILDANQYPTGKWICIFPANVRVGDIRSQIKLSDKTKGHVVSCHQLTTAELNGIRTASHYNITNRTVAFRNVHRDIGVAGLRHFLSNFKLLDHPANPLQNGTGNFLVHFADAAEAERAVQEKCGALIEGYSIDVFWYNC